MKGNQRPCLWILLDEGTFAAGNSNRNRDRFRSVGTASASSQSELLLCQKRRNYGRPFLPSFKKGCGSCGSYRAEAHDNDELTNKWTMLSITSRAVCLLWWCNLQANPRAWCVQQYHDYSYSTVQYC